MKRALLSLFTLITIVSLLFPIKVQASCEDDVVQYMNAARLQAGLDEVSLDSSLTELAMIRAKECSVSFSHIRPDGEAWSSVSVITNGENLARARNEEQSKPENVVLAWLLSPSHKVNVMRQSCTGVGVAYYRAEDGITYIVCEFN